MSMTEPLTWWLPASCRHCRADVLVLTDERGQIADLVDALGGNPTWGLHICPAMVGADGKPQFPFHTPKERP
jgi:hypothetical protein